MSASMNIVPLFDNSRGRGRSELDSNPFGVLRRVRIADGVIIEAQEPAELMDEQRRSGDNEQAPVVDIPALIAEARVGFQEEADLKLNEALEAQKRLFAEILETERAKWASEEGQRLSEALDANVKWLKETLEEKIGIILEPFISEQFLAQAIEEAGSLVESSLNNGGEVAISVTGPRDLLDAFSARVGARFVSLQVEDAQATDLSITVNDALIETKFGNWCKLVGKSLAP